MYLPFALFAGLLIKRSPGPLPYPRFDGHIDPGGYLHGVRESLTQLESLKNRHPAREGVLFVLRWLFPIWSESSPGAQLSLPCKDRQGDQDQRQQSIEKPGTVRGQAGKIEHGHFLGEQIHPEHVKRFKGFAAAGQRTEE